jgi:hypothetical protein
VLRQPENNPPRIFRHSRGSLVVAHLLAQRVFHRFPPCRCILFFIIFIFMDISLWRRRRRYLLLLLCIIRRCLFLLWWRIIMVTTGATTNVGVTAGVYTTTTGLCNNCVGAGVGTGGAAVLVGPVGTLGAVAMGEFGLTIMGSISVGFTGASVRRLTSGVGANVGGLTGAVEPSICTSRVGVAVLTAVGKFEVLGAKVDDEGAIEAASCPKAAL